jgi:hypothetical protein
MSAAPSEPEKYSIDEIMERLKNPSSDTNDQGELVTRADGSQALKIRKRKRRTNQPQKETARKNLKIRIFQISGFLILLFITAFALGGAIIYANSRPFFNKLTKNIERASGASVEMQQFRMNPKTANAAQALLKWPQGNVLQNLLLTGITAEIFPSSFLGKTFTGEEVSITQSSLSLEIPKLGQTVPTTSSLGDTLPIRFNRYRSSDFNLTLGPATTPFITLKKSQVALSFANADGAPQAALYQGDLAITGWPKLRLDRSLIIFRGASETELVNLRMLHESDNRGVFELSGKITPYKQDAPSELHVRLESFQMSGITGPAFGRLFSGRVDSLNKLDSNKLSFLPSEAPSTKLDISFHTSPSSQIDVQGFPFLFALSQALDDAWFEKPVFEENTTGEIHHEAGTLSLQNLSFIHKDRMALQGAIVLAEDQTLSGNLQVGIAEAMIVSSKNLRLKSMFTRQREGFFWITLKISGSTSAPMDNFRELYTSSVIEAKEPQKSSSSTFEELTQPK